MFILRSTLTTGNLMYYYSGLTYIFYFAGVGEDALSLISRTDERTLGDQIIG